MAALVYKTHPDIVWRVWVTSNNHTSVPRSEKIFARMAVNTRQLVCPSALTTISAQSVMSRTRIDRENNASNNSRFIEGIENEGYATIHEVRPPGYYDEVVDFSCTHPESCRENELQEASNPLYGLTVSLRRSLKFRTKVPPLGSLFRTRKANRAKLVLLCLMLISSIVILGLVIQVAGGKFASECSCDRRLKAGTCDLCWLFSIQSHRKIMYCILKLITWKGSSEHLGSERKTSRY